MLACAAVAGGCDVGSNDQPRVSGPPIRVLATNIESGTLPPGGRIEISFDRYLLPESATRQGLFLHDESMNSLNPAVSYDPVARVVTLTPTSTNPLQPGQSYAVDILVPSSPTDLNGLRAIDGATIDTSKPFKFPFVVSTGDGGAAPPPPPPTVDFCNDVFPLFQQRCGFSGCHAPPLPNQSPPLLPIVGLRLDSPAAIQATAINRVSQASNTGPVPAAEPPGLVFGIDMPIVDPNSGNGGGAPGHSWLMYKLLMAVPQPSDTAFATLDGGPPTDVTGLYADLSPRPGPALRDERDRLANLVQGREMPFPANPGAPLDQNTQALTFDELERVSQWIAQPPPGGRIVPPTCP